VFTEGPLGDTGFFSSAKAGADTAAAISAANRMRCVDICRSLLCRACQFWINGAAVVSQFR
jgi:hypothetical protein